MASFRLSNDKIYRLTLKIGAGLFLWLKHIKFYNKDGIPECKAKSFKLGYQSRFRNFKK